MEKLSKMESFQSFQISKKSMDEISGARTRFFQELEFGCAKIIDNNDQELQTIKYKDRYEGRC
jgi:hypothetical protein